jgi:hypothetical protein
MPPPPPPDAGGASTSAPAPSGRRPKPQKVLNLPPEEARLAAIAEIVAELIRGVKEGACLGTHNLFAF